MNLGKMIQILVEQKGWSLATLARRSGVPKTTLHGWCTGRAVQNLEQLRRVAAALEVSVHYLAFGSEDPFPKRGSHHAPKSGDQLLSPDNIKQLFSGKVRLIVESLS